MSAGVLLLRFVVTLPLLLLSLVAHELAHAYSADRLGDPTARRDGRLTLDPLVHLDRWGTVALVVTYLGSGGGFFFGWARPVSVQTASFRNPQRAMMLVGASGPAANAGLALAAAGLVWLTSSWSLFAAESLALASALNVVLCVVNLVPVPPLDGSRVVGGLLPRSVYPRWVGLDRYGASALVGLVVVLVAVPEVFQATLGAVLAWSYALLPGG